MSPPVVALLTDFGLRDPYVGMLRGVIAGIAPDARILDVTHTVPAHDVREGAFDLFIGMRFFPTHTVFCCVVDPGVGGDRRAVAVRLSLDGGVVYDLVGPDNGLFTGALQLGRVTAAALLDDPAYHLPVVSSTFHGRDVFAPVAAHLAAGADPREIGSPIDPASLVTLEWRRPRTSERGWEADIVHADQFGNLITNLPSASLGGDLGRWRVYLDDFEIGLIHRSFSDVAVGRPLAYVGSSGLLEIAVRNGRASDILSVDGATVVRVIAG
jgi:S-adenosylmethionine hydrolase